MKSYKGIEATVSTEAIVPTGRVLVFLANDYQEAAAHCLYTERLKNGNAKIGPTGRVVHSGNRCIAIVGQ